MLLYIAFVALFIAVIGLSCYQNSLESRIIILENEQKELKKGIDKLDNIIG